MASQCSTCSPSPPLLCRMQFKRAPVDQILFLRNRACTKLRGCGTLVTSDHGEARFWDLFGPDDPLGSFPLTQNPEEQVVALSTDRENHVLVAGDTAGNIAVFDIKDYCMVTGKVGSTNTPPLLLRTSRISAMSHLLLFSLLCKLLSYFMTLCQF